MRTLLAIALLSGCASEQTDPIPAIHFEMYDGAHYDPEPFNAAWRAARDTNRVDYAFPLISVDLPSRTEIRLLAGRSSNDPGYPTTTADDVLIADEHWLATGSVDGDGRVTFPSLAVTTGAWTSNTAAIPADFLCGNTVIAARAFERGGGEVPAYRFLASTFMVAVTACE